jgi:hypothetical protein
MKNLVKQVFNVMAKLPEKTEALTLRLLEGMKKLGIQTLNNAYDLIPHEQVLQPIRVTQAKNNGPKF